MDIRQPETTTRRMMMMMRDKTSTRNMDNDQHSCDNIGGHYDDEHEGITFASQTTSETTEEKKQKRLSTTTTTTTSRRVAAGGGSSVLVTCQAEKCTADLTDSKRYHRRHKVCEVHAKAPSVLVSGLRQRFCQQCSRFHELPEFDDTKRSCRRRLAGHNERRRKISSESQAEGGGSSSQTKGSNPQLRPCDQERANKTTQHMSSFSFPSGNVMTNNFL